MRMRDADGEVWEAQGDGSWIVSYPDGAYRIEDNLDLLDLWWGPLTEVSQP